MRLMVAGAGRGSLVREVACRSDRLDSEPMDTERTGRRQCNRIVTPSVVKTWIWMRAPLVVFKIPLVL